MHLSAQQTNEGETAGVITRSPLLFLAALLLGFALERLVPSAFTLSGCYLVHWTVGGSLILIGFALAAAGVRNFSQAAAPGRHRRERGPALNQQPAQTRMPRQRDETDGERSDVASNDRLAEPKGNVIENSCVHSLLWYARAFRNFE